MKHLVLAASLLIGAAPALAQTPSVPADDEQKVLLRGLVEAVRANTEALNRERNALDTLSSRLERVETAVRTVPPSVEGLRTDIIAIRSTLDKVASGQGAKRPAVTLRFGPFVCGNETEASCAISACKSVGYPNGIAVTVNRRQGSAAAVSMQDATCYDS
jgi:hypothetical protein